LKEREEEEEEEGKKKEAERNVMEMLTEYLQQSGDRMKS
jgi:hypothetical protein